MASYLPQKYQEVPKELISYIPEKTDQVALITIEPALPCFICSQPATMALITPAPDHTTSTATAWLTFPICEACEKRQVERQSGSNRR
jgi:hypothetical protein